MNKPPWDAPCDEMEVWINARLDELDARLDDSFEPAAAGLDTAVDAAEHGDIGPLQRLYPRLAPYLRLPRRRKGVKFQRPKEEDRPWDHDNPYWRYAIAERAARPSRGSPRHLRLEAAVRDVPWIRKIWQKEYGKLQRKKDSGLVTAEQIAARRWACVRDGVLVEDISVACILAEAKRLAKIRVKAETSGAY